MLRSSNSHFENKDQLLFYFILELQLQLQLSSLQSPVSSPCFANNTTRLPGYPTHMTRTYLAPIYSVQLPIDCSMVMDLW